MKKLTIFFILLTIGLFSCQKPDNGMDQVDGPGLSKAPRGGYGFNLIWGDTQSNFTQKNGQIGALSVTKAGVNYLVADWQKFRKAFLFYSRPKVLKF